MRNIKNLVCIKVQLVLILFLFNFCARFHKLATKDLEWMPYKGNETLVFRSNTGDVDTIFFIKKDTMTAYPEAQAMFGTTYEVVGIFCRFTDSSEKWFYSVEKEKDGRAALQIDITAKDAWFYRLSHIRIDSLNNVRPVSLKTKYAQYTDVYIIEDEDWMGNFHLRSDYITRIFWSRSQGLIRYDKQGDVYWELEKKY